MSTATRNLLRLASRDAELAILETRCAICWDDIVDPVQTPCGHCFCGPCIKDALRLGQRRECPTCRCPIASHRVLREGSAVLEEQRLLSVPDHSWECTMCTLHNAVAESRCSACGARKPMQKRHEDETPRPQPTRKRERTVSETKHSVDGDGADAAADAAVRKKRRHNNHWGFSRRARKAKAAMR